MTIKATPTVRMNPDFKADVFEQAGEKLGRTVYEDAPCTCGHKLSLHTPGGALGIEGRMACEEGGCPCEKFEPKDN